MRSKPCTRGIFNWREPIGRLGRWRFFEGSWMPLRSIRLGKPTCGRRNPLSLQKDSRLFSIIVELLLLVFNCSWRFFFIFIDFFRSTVCFSFLDFFFVPTWSLVVFEREAVRMDDFFGVIGCLWSRLERPRRRVDGSARPVVIICKRCWSMDEMTVLEFFLFFDNFFGSSARSNKSSRNASTSDLLQGNGRSVMVAIDSESNLNTDGAISAVKRTSAILHCITPSFRLRIGGFRSGRFVLDESRNRPPM